MTLAQWLAREPFTLSLSSGFFGFFAHCGVLMALEEHGLAPVRVTGSSAGALIAGMYGAGLPPRGIAEVLRTLRREDFWDPFPGPGLLRGRRFREMIEHYLPARDFAECPRAVSVSAWEVFSHRTRYFTEGPLAPAIHASCCVPLLFHPVWIGRQAYVDGGIGDRPGLAGTPPGTRVLHHHLASRSPWRSRRSPALQPPRQEGLVSLVLEGLPRSGPSRLDAGRRALGEAYEGACEALGESIGALSS